MNPGGHLIFDGLIKWSYLIPEMLILLRGIGGKLNLVYFLEHPPSHLG